MYTELMPLPFSEQQIGLLVVITIWSIIWKGFALWKAARLGHRGWFIALLILNTAGILPILYLFIFTKKKPDTTNQAA